MWAWLNPYQEQLFYETLEAAMEMPLDLNFKGPLWKSQEWYNQVPWIGKGGRQGCILSPCLFNLNAEYIMRNTGLEEAQAGIKIAGRNINNLRYADDTTLMAEMKN